MEEQIEFWVRKYGYHAVAPALLADPAGVPWAWIFLMLLAGEAHLNLGYLLVYGYLVLMASDHALYWTGALGRHRLIPAIVARWPQLGPRFEAARREVDRRQAAAIIFGRYLPFVGRWLGVGAGLAGVSYLRFCIYEALGAALSVFGFGLVAHWLGRQIVDHPLFNQLFIAAFVGSTVLGSLFWLVSRLRRKTLPNS